MNASEARQLVAQRKVKEKEISMHRIMALFESIKIAATNGRDQIPTGFALTKQEEEYLKEKGYQISQETRTDQRQGDYTETVVKWPHMERPSFDNSEKQY